MAQSSLPYQHAAQALTLLRSTMPVIRTWPQLPQRSLREERTVQSALGFPGLVVDDANQRMYVEREQAVEKLDILGLAYLRGNSSFCALTWEDALGLAEMLRLPAQLTECRAISSQLLGPISLGLYLTDELYHPLLYDPTLREALGEHLALRVNWLTTRMNNLVGDSILCLDEPLLMALNSPFCPIDWNDGLELLQKVFESTVGCCGVVLSELGTRQQDYDLTRSWEPLLETSVDLVLLDVYRHEGLLLAASSILSDFLDRPGMLAWGLIPTDQEALERETADTLVAHFEHVLDQCVQAGLSREQILHASIISTNDHLSQLSVVNAERALRLCAEVSTRLRKKYALEHMG